MEKLSRRGREGTGDRDRRVGGRDGSERRGSASFSGNAESIEWKEIPFSWVIRGRQESHLVDQQVTHIETHELRYSPQNCYQINSVEVAKDVQHVSSVRPGVAMPAHLHAGGVLDVSQHRPS